MAALDVPHLLHPLLPAWRPAWNIVRPIHRQERIAQAAANLRKLTARSFRTGQCNGLSGKRRRRG